MYAFYCFALVRNKWLGPRAPSLVPHNWFLELLMGFALVSVASLVLRFFARVLGAFVILGVTSFFQRIIPDTERLWVAGTAGSISGFIIIVGFVIPLLAHTTRAGFGTALIFCLLFTSICQLGAICGARRKQRHVGVRVENSCFGESPQFSLAHVFWLTFGMCLCFGALKYLRLDSVIPFLLIWFVAQSLILSVLLLAEYIFTRIRFKWWSPQNNR